MGIEDDLNKDRNTIPQGTVIGLDAKGEELKTWAPLRLEPKSITQLIEGLEQNENVLPLDEDIKYFMTRFSPSPEKRVVSTCIVRLDQLGYVSSPSSKELADPQTIKNLSKDLLKGYEFESLPEVAIYEAVIQASNQLPGVDKYKQEQDVYPLSRGSGSIPKVCRQYNDKTKSDNKVSIWGRDNNKEYRWKTNDAVLLGVRRLLRKQS